MGTISVFLRSRQHHTLSVLPPKSPRAKVPEVHLPGLRLVPMSRRKPRAVWMPVIRYYGQVWRADRAAEGDGLENRCVSNGTGGSNPSPSANPPDSHRESGVLFQHRAINTRATPTRPALLRAHAFALSTPELFKCVLFANLGCALETSHSPVECASLLRR